MKSTSNISTLNPQRQHNSQCHFRSINKISFEVKESLSEMGQKKLQRRLNFLIGNFVVVFVAVGHNFGVEIFFN